MRVAVEVDLREAAIPEAVEVHIEGQVARLSAELNVEVDRLAHSIATALDDAIAASHVISAAVSAQRDASVGSLSVEAIAAEGSSVSPRVCSIDVLASSMVIITKPLRGLTDQLAVGDLAASADRRRVHSADVDEAHDRRRGHWIVRALPAEVVVQQIRPAKVEAHALADARRERRWRRRRWIRCIRRIRWR